MSDFNIFNHLNTMGFGRGGGKDAGPNDGTNEKETMDAALDNAGNAVGNLLSGVTGVNASQLGQTSIAKPFEYEGFADAKIPSFISKISPNGGMLANILHAVFVKNREITDHTRYINESDSGAGAGGDSGFSDYSTMDMGSLVSASDYPDYSMSNVSFADLGGFPPPSVGTGQSSGMELS